MIRIAFEPETKTPNNTHTPIKDTNSPWTHKPTALELLGTQCSWLQVDHFLWSQVYQRTNARSLWTGQPETSYVCALRVHKGTRAQRYPSSRETPKKPPTYLS